MKRKILPVLICTMLLILPCSTALAEDATPDVEELESRIADLEERVQALEGEVDVLLNGGDIVFTFGDVADDEANTEAADGEKEEASEFNFGETWTVDGEWEITVESVEETSYRDEYSELEPAAVYVLTYTYTNLGYDWDDWGLYISLDGGIVDSEGYMGYSYFVDVSYYPTETPVGATCRAQVGIGVDHPGDFKINYKAYDDNGKAYSAVFNVPVS